MMPSRSLCIITHVLEMKTPSDFLACKCRARSHGSRGRILSTMLPCLPSNNHNARPGVSFSVSMGVVCRRGRTSGSQSPPEKFLFSIIWMWNREWQIFLKSHFAIEFLFTLPREWIFTVRSQNILSRLFILRVPSHPISHYSKPLSAVLFLTCHSQQTFTDL